MKSPRSTDPMIGKLIVWDETRELALSRMEAALAEFQVVGVTTNIPWLRSLVSTASFAGADLDTGLIEREEEHLLGSDASEGKVPCVLATLVALLSERSHVQDDTWQSPWTIQDGWRMGNPFRRTLKFLHGKVTCDVSVEYRQNDYLMRIGDQEFVVAGELETDGRVISRINGARVHATVIQHLGAYHVFCAGQNGYLQMGRPARSRASEPGSAAERPARAAPWSGHHASCAARKCCRARHTRCWCLKR